MAAGIVAPVIPSSGRLAAGGHSRTGAARRLPVAAVPVIPAIERASLIVTSNKSLGKAHMLSAAPAARRAAS